MRHCFVRFLLLLALPLLLLAQTETERNTTLLGITVSGNQTTDENLIRINSGLRTGQPVSGEDVQHAIRQLWDLGRFSSVEVLLTRELPDGIYMEIQVEELPRVGEIEIQGNDKLRTSRIREVVDEHITLEQPATGLELYEVQQGLLRAYEKESYRLAMVEVDVVDVVDGRGTLLINIDEGRRVRIDEVIIEGNEVFRDSKLIRRMKKTRPRRIFRSGKFDAEAYEEDKDRVVEFLRNEGYRDARIVADSVWVDDTSGNLKVLLNVYEGSQYYFGSINWEGNTVFGNDFLTSQLLFREGDVYSLKKFERSMQEGLHDLYYNRGYIQARIEPVEVPRGDNVIDLVFQIVEGNVFSVHRVDFMGNDKTKDKVLRREMNLHPGDTFDVARLRRSLRNITILNYFDQPVPQVDVAGEDEVNLTIEVREKNTDQINMSAGYSEQDGLVGSLGFTLNNLMGNGQKLIFDWQFAEDYRSLSLEFQEPFLWDRPILAGFKVFDIQRTTSYSWDFDQRLRGGSVTLGRRLNWPDNYFRISSTYRLEESLYTNFDEDARDDLERRGIIEDEPQIASTLAIALTRDSRDHAEFPQNGSTLRLQSEFGGGLLQGDHDFHKYTLEARSYSTFLSKLITYTVMEAGVVDALHEGGNVPWIKRFFMGGSGMSLGTALRGYSDRSVGTGEDGGRVMTKLGAEVRLQLLPNPTIYGLCFYEAGNVWKNLHSASLNDLNRSAGLGMRLYMPMIGLIGLDYAYGFDRIDSATGLRKGDWQFHFQFGREF